MKKINGAVLLQTVILAAYCLAFIALLITGQIKSYVHPRIEKYAWFAVVALLLMTVSMIPMIKKPRRHNRWLPSFLLIIPLLTGFALPAAVNKGTLQLNNSLLPKSGYAAAASPITQKSSPDSTIASSAASSDAFSAAPSSPSSAPTSSTPSASSSDTASAAELSDTTSTAPISSTPDKSKTTVIDSNGIPVVQDDAFLSWLDEVYNNPAAYKGKTVKLRGFVYRDDTLKSNEFVPARMSMVCCAADITACGFLCRSTDAQKWKTNEWVWVTATIGVEYNAENKVNIPVLTAQKIEPAEKPKVEIAYPY